MSKYHWLLFLLFCSQAVIKAAIVGTVDFGSVYTNPFSEKIIFSKQFFFKNFSNYNFQMLDTYPTFSLDSIIMYRDNTFFHLF